MIPEKQLPYPGVHASADEYVEALLEFVTTSSMLQTLCGGVHILDFLVREPDLYETVLPPEWRAWLRPCDISDVLDLLMREDINDLLERSSGTSSYLETECGACKSETSTVWRGGPLPPESLLLYIQSIRNLTLDRSCCSPHPFSDEQKLPVLSRQIAVGMRPKKAHEVVNFAAFVDKLALDLSHASVYNISHLVDFGSGQNYLGRVLASPLYRKSVVAVESKKLNIDEAKTMDVIAKLAKKRVIWRDKKKFRMQGEYQGLEEKTTDNELEQQLSGAVDRPLQTRQTSSDATENGKSVPALDLKVGNIQYIEHRIVDADLTAVIEQLNINDVVNSKIKEPRTCVPEASEESSYSEVPSLLPTECQLMVISLHSCGNLIHHGLRSLVLNESVKAVAMVGCCYNLMTERLGPPTYKLPTLRPQHPRLDRTAQAWDPNGFPMSERMSTYRHRNGEGIRLNITSRMMAVQAPLNWTSMECDNFFKRHFYRALLQRVFLDQGVVGQPTGPCDVVEGSSSCGWSGVGEPIVIGSLRKHCYTSFPSYVRGALAKLAEDPVRGMLIKERTESLTDGQLIDYEQKYEHKKHELSLIWSLMAFSATVIESVIVVDRWLYLKEQREVRDCWVQSVFDYSQSPRNLVVVGVKR